MLPQYMYVLLEQGKLGECNENIVYAISIRQFWLWSKDDIVLITKI